MTPAEQKAYSRGYQAGKRRKQRDIHHETQRSKARAFKERVFLAMLPVVFGREFNWGKTVEGVHTPFNTKEERIAFACNVAEASLQQHYKL